MKKEDIKTMEKLYADDINARIRTLLSDPNVLLLSYDIIGNLSLTDELISESNDERRKRYFNSELTERCLSHPKCVFHPRSYIFLVRTKTEEEREHILRPNYTTNGYDIPDCTRYSLLGEIRPENNEPHNFSWLSHFQDESAILVCERSMFSLFPKVTARKFISFEDEGGKIIQKTERVEETVGHASLNDHFPKLDKETLTILKQTIKNQTEAVAGWDKRYRVDTKKRIAELHDAKLVNYLSKRGILKRLQNK